MKIYHYHPEHRYFICEGVAEPSPLDPPGVWLIPAYSTTLEPPNFEDGFIPLFTNYSWEIIEDNRGIYYDKFTLQEIENDNPLIYPKNSTKEKPPEVPAGKRVIWEDGWIIENFPNPIHSEDNLSYSEDSEDYEDDDIQNLTPEQKLERLGLSISDLKVLLGIQ